MPVALLGERHVGVAEPLGDGERLNRPHLEQPCRCGVTKTLERHLGNARLPRRSLERRTDTVGVRRGTQRHPGEDEILALPGVAHEVALALLLDAPSREHLHQRRGQRHDTAGVAAFPALADRDATARLRERDLGDVNDRVLGVKV